jgi:hypothetical protein
MKPSCPRCHKTFGLFSGPRMQSCCRSPITDLHCPFCQASLKVEQSHRFTLTILALIIFLSVAVFGAKWALWRLYAPDTALALRAAVVILLIGFLAVAFSRQVKYVPRP